MVDFGPTSTVLAKISKCAKLQNIIYFPQEFITGREKSGPVLMSDFYCRSLLYPTNNTYLSVPFRSFISRFYYGRQNGNCSRRPFRCHRTLKLNKSLVNYEKWTKMYQTFFVYFSFISLANHSCSQLYVNDAQW